MGLRDIEIKKEYRTSYDDIVKDFYIPLLKESIYYKRAVGFFSSTSLSEIVEGIEELVKNNGKIQIVASPKLQEEDIEAIEKGYRLRDEIIESVLLKELKEPDNEFEKDRLNLLASLIAENVLDIKIAIIENSNNIGIYHEKLGILEDIFQDKVVFTGSLNETSTAFNMNYETIDVFTSWEDEERVLRKIQAFDNIWNNNEKKIKVIDFPKVKEEIIKKYRYKKEDIELKKDEENTDIEVNEKIKLIENTPTIPDDVKLYDYQLEAIKNWEENDFRGIFDMATGSGKTLTGLGALCKLSKKLDNNLFVVIVCPYQHLVEQWVEDIERFNIKPIIGYSASRQKRWKERLNNSIIMKNLKIKDKEFYCFICTNATFSSKYVQDELKKIKENILILVDEAHNFGTYRLSKLLDEKYKFRLALSATLERVGDEEGTKKLYNFFEKKCIEYPLEKAIKDGKLTPYKYYPILVNLSFEEREEYLKLTQELLKNIIIDLDGKKKLTEYGKMISIKRARLVAGAKSKLEILKREIYKYKNDNFLLIYCGATNILEENKDSTCTSEKDIRQIDAVIKILGNELNMKVSPFTSNENIEERELIKNEFKSGDSLQALVAIKCLDEGVNIPNIKTAFILASTTNPKEHIQRRGRVLRLAKNKEYAEIYDFITLPRELEKVPYTSPFDIEKEKSLVKKEIKRMKEFGRLALNPINTDLIIFNIKTAYNISDDNRGDDYDEFEY
ncbi:MULTISPECIES: DEAD/DEAH box helicase family protein [Fusobacterium]|uniref:DEAD/DEAH box helicase family protein n=1 Tax=Fusobacterium TaxID=848 RepID=UPI001476871C|nr:MULTISPECIES: DEAD/DEAH box helicase family protein [Fusobacterium]NME35036.1 DEAD/DEAH box helicase family protein [Fusobacterium sp. FSA-380-WT-3A]